MEVGRWVPSPFKESGDTRLAGRRSEVLTVEQWLPAVPPPRTHNKTSVCLPRWLLLSHKHSRLLQLGGFLYV